MSMDFRSDGTCELGSSLAPLKVPCTYDVNGNEIDVAFTQKPKPGFISVEGSDSKTHVYYDLLDNGQTLVPKGQSEAVSRQMGFKKEPSNS